MKLFNGNKILLSLVVFIFVITMTCIMALIQEYKQRSNLTLFFQGILPRSYKVTKYQSNGMSFMFFLELSDSDFLDWKSRNKKFNLWKDYKEDRYFEIGGGSDKDITIKPETGSEWSIVDTKWAQSDVIIRQPKSSLLICMRSDSIM